MLLVRRIVGESMLPVLRPGAIVIVMKRRRYAPGDVVLFRHNGLDKIKRISALKNAQVYLLGDNPAHSTDSRSFGWLDQSVLRGVIVWSLAAVRRRRRQDQ